MLPRSALTLAFAAFLCPVGLFAQSSQADADAVAPAHVSHVEGAVSLEREGRLENAPLNMPLLSGDRLKTLEGRAEVLFADGSALHLDTRTTLDIQSDELVRLIDGRVRLNVAGPSRAVSYRVDSPAGSVRITQPGEYRVALLHGQTDTQLELAVVRGGGEIFTDQGSTPVRAGERAYSSEGLAPSYPYTFNSAGWDAFDRWSEARRDMRLGVSTQYLPADVRPYASTFDEYGDWRYQQSYGYVWYPRVAADWRPYYYGRWASYPRYGWTWIGVDAFAWPTHHYGRWGFSAGTWFWIPASRWAPAYVSWAYAPGYVSWCPLGFDNRPIIGIDIYRVGPGYYSSARAWTAVSDNHFGRDYYVHQRAVNWDRADAGRRPPFAIAATAPAARNDIAVPRGASGASRASGPVEERTATPIRWAGSRDIAPRGGSRADVAVPRAGSAPATAGGATPGPGASPTPRYVNRGDQIVRSRTERPSAPASPGNVRPAPAPAAPMYPNVRDGYATPRTAPPVPARRADGMAPAPYDRQPQAPGYARPDAPAYAPRTGDPRPYEPAGRAPQYARPRAGGEDPRPAPAAAPPDSAPAPAPRADERREPPPQRATPPSAPAAPRGTAVPRDGGRGSAPAGSIRRGRGGI